jgi:hypothetical protein
MVQSETHGCVGARRLAVVVGAVSLAAMGLLMSGCGNGGQPAQPSTPTTTTSTPTPKPTDKDVSPDGPNLFTPSPRFTPPEKNY